MIKHDLTVVLKLFNGTIITKQQKEIEEMKINQLGDYTPEKVTDSDFDMMKGKGHICRVVKSLFEDVPAGVRRDNGEPYEAYTKLSYELEVIDEKYKGRKVWKNYNLSSEEATGKKPKTPIQKLADVFFTIGLEFSDEVSLRGANDQFVEKTLAVSFNSFKPGDKEIQLHTITGDAPASWENEATPSEGSKPALAF